MFSGPVIVVTPFAVARVALPDPLIEQLLGAPSDVNAPAENDSESAMPAPEIVPASVPETVWVCPPSVVVTVTGPLSDAPECVDTHDNEVVGVCPACPTDPVHVADRFVSALPPDWSSGDVDPSPPQATPRTVMRMIDLIFMLSLDCDCQR